MPDLLRQAQGSIAQASNDLDDWLDREAVSNAEDSADYKAALKGLEDATRAIDRLLAPDPEPDMDDIGD